ncbi:hypothetical protein TSUD_67320 [Trifolium subterraneum]|uniref:Uncharacterized protein n=1 Tax=Trifolium subterraneum TaxID=3900 RepID=A0A2Z6NDF5_TRISU|nr:hypothetical protein TSUD_67320 [Trifolium subterraneum]
MYNTDGWDLVRGTCSEAEGLSVNIFRSKIWNKVCKLSHVSKLGGRASVGSSLHGHVDAR